MFFIENKLKQTVLFFTQKFDVLDKRARCPVMHRGRFRESVQNKKGFVAKKRNLG